MWPKKMSSDSSIVLLYPAYRHYRTTENSIRGLVITIIDSLSALAPPRDQDSARLVTPPEEQPLGEFLQGGAYPLQGRTAWRLLAAP